MVPPKLLGLQIEGEAQTLEEIDLKIFQLYPSELQEEPLSGLEPPGRGGVTLNPPSAQPKRKGKELSSNRFYAENIP